MSGTTSRRRGRGLALIELLIAGTLGALLLGALATLARDGLQVHQATRSSHEMAYQARFALARVVGFAEAAAPRPLVNPPAGTSGDWFGATMFCLRTATSQLIETTPADTGCSAGTRVVGERITAFSVVLPAGGAPLDRPRAQISVTASDARGAESLTVSATPRIGGSTR